MPNWCENTLDIYGDESELKEFLSLITQEIPATEDLPRIETIIQLIETFIPQPKDVEDWYSWSVINWGSKSADCETSASQVFSYFNNISRLQIIFLSAWTSVVPAIITISKKFPNFTFMLFYEEHGMGFAGYCFVKAGRIIEEDLGKYIPRADQSEILFDFISDTESDVM
jgi:hypothetical protein